MTPIQQLKLILNKSYFSEDGDEYEIELNPGLNAIQIQELREHFPNQYIPAEIEELLKLTSGFSFYPLEEIAFDGVDQFGFEEFFPCTVQLMVDGLGNSYVVDIKSDGSWGNIFYVLHDPAVAIKFSENLSEFIRQIDDFGQNENHSDIGSAQQTAEKIWEEETGFIDLETARQSEDQILKNFALSLPDNFVVADLRNKPNGSGFAWGKFGPRTDLAERHETELLWGVEKQIKKSFFSRLFGK